MATDLCVLGVWSGALRSAPVAWFRGFAWGNALRSPAPLALAFSVSQVKRLMTAVPRTEAAAITDARNRLAHFAGPVDLDQVQHPLVTASCGERAELVMSLARLAPGPPRRRV